MTKKKNVSDGKSKFSHVVPFSVVKSSFSVTLSGESQHITNFPAPVLEETGLQRENEFERGDLVLGLGQESESLTQLSWNPFRIGGTSKGESTEPKSRI